MRYRVSTLLAFQTSIAGVLLTITAMGWPGLSDRNWGLFFSGLIMYLVGEFWFAFTLKGRK